MNLAANILRAQATALHDKLSIYSNLIQDGRISFFDFRSLYDDHLWSEADRLARCIQRIAKSKGADVSVIVTRPRLPAPSSLDTVVKVLGELINDIPNEVAAN
jgi:hypothetical protein